jgi:hypothetical protein
MHAMRRLSLLLLASTCALGVVACGGSSSKALTGAQYQAKVSHLCVLAGDGFHELHLTLSMADWRRHADEITAINDTFHRKVTALVPPPEVQHNADSFIAAYQKVFADDLAAIDAAKANDAKKFHAALSKAGQDVAATYPWASAIGAGGCYS